MPLYYVTIRGNRCGLRGGKLADIRRAIGTDNIVSIRRATKDDIAYVRSMGGVVPKKESA